MPNVVKGSRQHRMIVVPYRPWRRFLLLSACVLTLVVSASGAYLFGFSSARSQLESGSLQNEQMRGAALQAEGELSQLRERLAIAEQNSRVDRRAIEESQATINTLRRRLSRMEQDVELYRQVLASGDEAEGLQVMPPEVRTTTQAGRYQYRLVFRQQGLADEVLEANGKMIVHGLLAGEAHQELVYGVAPGEDDTGPNLSFRYFQVLEGEFILPPGFQPGALEVTAEMDNGEDMSETFSWSVQEANDVRIR